MMMAERARRLEAAEPDQRREVAAVWSRAVQRQALMVKRMAAEVEQLNAAAQLQVRDRSGGYAA